MIEVYGEPIPAIRHDGALYDPKNVQAEVVAEYCNRKSPLKEWDIRSDYSLRLKTGGTLTMDDHIETENTRRDKGFSLVELLIVIVILGILATVVVFAVTGMTNEGKTTSLQGRPARSTDR